MTDPTGATFGSLRGAARPPRRRGYLVPGMIALVVVAAIGVVIDIAGLQHHTPRVLAGPDVATYIAQGMQFEQRSARPPSISCPASEPVRPGLRFDCRLTLASGVRRVEVDETSGRGQFTWRVLDLASQHG